MKQVTLILIPLIVALAQPTAAQEQEDGRSLMEQGAELFFDGLREELDPALRELRDLAQEYGPAMRDFAVEMGPKLEGIMDEVKDWSAYQAPEILPNGDIIIRRKPDHPLQEPETPTEPAPQVDL